MLIHERAKAIEHERHSLEETLRSSSRSYSALVKHLADFYGEPQKEGGLNPLQRTLISLGMAVKNGSESAIHWTITRAFNRGATAQMIQDTVDIALLNGGSFTVANARFAIHLLQSGTTHQAQS